MLSLDEAIKHCEEVAEAEEQKYKDWKGDYPHLKKIDSCLECAKEHRQLAKWLTKLKAYEDIIFELVEAMYCHDGCEKCQGFSEYPTYKFVNDVRKFVKQFEEVKN